MDPRNPPQLNGAPLAAHLAAMRPATHYALAAAAVGGAALLRWTLDPILATTMPFLLFVPAVMLSSWFGGLFPGLFATALSIVAADLFIASGGGSWPATSAEMVVFHFVFLLVGILISSLADQLHGERRRAERVAEQRLELLEGQVRAEASLHAVEEERRAALETAERARRQAEDAARLKEEFLATVSHELRNPLNAIVGWAHVLEGQEGQPGENAEAIAGILRSAEAQTRLIGDLLDISRILSGKMSMVREKVDVDGLADVAVEAIRPSAEAKALRLVSRHETAEEVAVQGDVQRLEQALKGLLDNAVKFTPPGGLVEVAVRRAGPDAEITVSDTGVGIAAELLPHVFDRFRQGDGSSRRRHGGLGLGLAIVHDLIARHGGSVRAESAGRDQGAVFTVRLPATNGHAATSGHRAGGNGAHAVAEPPGAAAPTASSLAGVRVMVVEDDGETRAMMNRLLSGHGARVETAASAAECLSHLPRFHPHVLVSDIGMPGENGYDLIRQVRALRPEQGGRTPALALTAFAREQDSRRALAAGFESYLAKPVAAGDLVHTVADLAERMRR